MDSIRIISLLASSTEIIHALGYGKQMVGRSHECDYPSIVQSLPVCSEPKFDITGSSRDIDQRVKELAHQNMAIYQIKTDLMKELRPDVIVTQDHCKVCAVSLKDVEQAVCEWGSNPPKIVALNPNCLSDIWEGIMKVADALGSPQKGRELVDHYQSQIHTISAKAAHAKPTPSVGCIEWLDPLMAAGNWVPELVSQLHAQSVFGEAGKHSPWMNWDDLIQKDPDILVMMPCGWDTKKTEQEMPVLTKKKEWSDLKAVRNKRVYLVDGNQYFNRPGPRLVESLEILAEIFYPELFRFGFENNGWRRF